MTEIYDLVIIGAGPAGRDLRVKSHVENSMGGQ